MHVSPYFGMYSLALNITYIEQAFIIKISLNRLLPVFPGHWFRRMHFPSCSTGLLCGHAHLASHTVAPRGIRKKYD